MNKVLILFGVVLFILSGFDFKTTTMYETISVFIAFFVFIFMLFLALIKVNLKPLLKKKCFGRYK